MRFRRLISALLSVCQSHLRNILAGFPTTTLLAGTFLVTTLPAPTKAFSPIVTFARIVAPEPMEAPFFTRGRLYFPVAFQSEDRRFLVVARGKLSLINATL